MINPDVDGYIETLNHWKMLQKLQKHNNLLETKIILKPKYKLSGAQFLYLACQGAILPSSHSVSYDTGHTFTYCKKVTSWMNAKNENYSKTWKNIGRRETPLDLLIATTPPKIRSENPFLLGFAGISITTAMTVYWRKSFLSTESDTKILQCIYFAYKVGIISSYSNRNLRPTFKYLLQRCFFRGP